MLRAVVEAVEAVAVRVDPVAAMLLVTYLYLTHRRTKQHGACNHHHHENLRVVDRDDLHNHHRDHRHRHRYHPHLNPIINLNLNLRHAVMS